MGDLQALLARQRDLSSKMDAIEQATGEDGMTDDQRAAYDGLVERAEATSADIERLTKRRELERATVERVNDKGLAMRGAWEAEAEDVVDEKDVTAPMVYHGLEGLAPDDPIRIKSAFGQMLIDAKRFETEHVLTEPLAKIQAAATGAGENVGSDGGFLVQTDIGGLLQRQIVESSQLLSRVRNVPLGPNSNSISFNAIDETSRAAGSRFGGVRGYWLAEADAVTASKPKFRELELKLNKVAALGYATDELGQDFVAIGNLFFDAFAEELRFLVEDAIMNGTGSGQPLGILTSDAEVSIAKESGQTAATIVQANLSKMYARLHSRSKPNSVWFHNTDCHPELDNLFVAGASSDLEARFVTYSADGVTRIKGRPAVETEYNATLGTVGDIVLADLSQYLFISKAMRMASSMHVRFVNDEQAFRVTWRVDGRPAWISALTPYKGSNTLSPFVSVATRA